MVEGLGDLIGGPAESVSLLSGAQAEMGHDVCLWAFRRPGEGEAAPIDPRVAVQRFDFGWPLALRRVPGIAAALRALEPPPDIVHVHGLWMDAYRAVTATARDLRIPYVVSTRGMLLPEARARHHGRKGVISLLWQRRHLKRAGAVHASSQRSADAAAAYGTRAPIRVIPEGMSLEGPAEPVAPELTARFRNRLEPAGRDARLLLFIGRIVEHKGLLDLARSWNDLGEARDGWHLALVGPDPLGFLPQLREQLSGACSYTGPVGIEERWAAHQAASIVVLPSYSESFGRVVAEGLLAGRPVITTQQTPWEVLETERCGWWIDRADLTSTLRVALATSPDELTAMGRRGQKWARDNLGEETVAGLVSQLYEELLGGR